MSTFRGRCASHAKRAGKGCRTEYGNRPCLRTGGNMVFPGSRNVSESARPASLELWLFDLDSGEEAERLSMDLLNEEERLRAARFVRASDRRHFAVCRACVKSVIASRIPGLNAQSITFAYGPWGKPRWGDISFSISHSQSLGLLALSPSGPLGCDIEWHGRQTDPVGVASYFTLQERLAVYLL